MSRSGRRSEAVLALVLARAAEHGFESVWAATERFPEGTLPEVAAGLGVTPAQLGVAIVAEGVATRRLKSCSQDLARRLLWQHAPAGCGLPQSGHSWTFVSALAGAEWMEYLMDGGAPLTEDVLLDTWRKVEASIPAPGWRPGRGDVSFAEQAHASDAWASA